VKFSAIVIIGAGVRGLAAAYGLALRRFAETVPP
jgi:glycine/D-amino acid oxidase-like deaminating enzyme